MSPPPLASSRPFGGGQWDARDQNLYNNGSNGDNSNNKNDTTQQGGLCLARLGGT